jgi:hypothetical protein
MKRDCARWLAELEATLATVVIEARDTSGAELTEVRVAVDKEPLADRLDGRPLEVDPGEHTITFTTSDGRTIEQRHVVHAGDRLARIAVVFDVAPPPPVVVPSPVPAPAPSLLVPSHAHPESERPVAPSRRSPATLASYGVGAFAVLAAGVGTVLAATGLAHEHSLGSSCAPRCPVSEVDDLHHQYIAADVFFGVAIVSAGTAIALFVTGRSLPGRSDAAARVLPIVTPFGGGILGSF